MSTIDGNLKVNGHLTTDTMALPDSSVTNASVASNAAIARSKLAQDTLKPFALTPEDWRVWDVGMHLILPATPAADDLGLITGTLGTAPAYVSAGDLKAAGATTRYARRTIHLPAEYDAGETIVVRFRAGMLTTIADVSATIDLQAYLIGDTTVGSDLCTTAATTINSLTFASVDFTITPTSLVAGDGLDIRVAIAVNDAATATAVTAAIAKSWLLCDVRG